MMVKSVIWSQEERDKAIQMARNGHTATEIAKQLNNRSRNSVIGFLHRQKIFLQNYRVVQEKPFRPKVVKFTPPEKKKSQPFVNSVVIPIEAKPVRLIGARRMECKYIVLKPENVFDTMCCGSPVHNGSSWCQKHYQIVFQPRQEKRNVK